MNVSGICEGGLDQTGNTIVTIYYRNPPHYAIFRTAQRVVILYHDVPDEQARQRRQLAPVNPLRGQIDGLIDDWRGPPTPRKGLPENPTPGMFGRGYQWLAGDGDSPHRRAAAASYDRRVADALSLALEDDVPSALLYLEGVKRDIEDERNARARRFYVSIAAITSVALVVAAWWHLVWSAYAAEGANLMLAAGAGALGAFFSVAIATRNRTPLTDLRLWDSGIDAILRVMIGMIGAVVLIGLFRTGLVSSVAFGDGAARLTPGTGDYSWMLVAVIGFLAGFVERLVNDLLGKVVVSTDPPKVAAPLASKADEKGGTAAIDNKPGAMGVASEPSATPPNDADDQGGDCLCEIVVEQHELTPDDALPAATGGVVTVKN